jgi:hypothetical protein
VCCDALLLILAVYAITVPFAITIPASHVIVISIHHIIQNPTRLRHVMRTMQVLMMHVPTCRDTPRARRCRLCRQHAHLPTNRPNPNNGIGWCAQAGDPALAAAPDDSAGCVPNGSTAGAAAAADAADSGARAACALLRIWRHALQ